MEINSSGKAQQKSRKILRKFLIFFSASPTKKEEGEEEVKEKPSAKAGYRKWQSRAPPPLLGQKERPVGKPNCLAGFDFLLTGNVFFITRNLPGKKGILPSIEREDCHDLIKQYGGTISKSVTKKLTHVVLGEDAGESKMTKIRENPKIKILSEDELFAMISNGAEKAAPPEKPVKAVKASPKKPIPTASVSVASATTTNATTGKT
jgi:replication factor C subunit 1